MRLSQARRLFLFLFFVRDLRLFLIRRTHIGIARKQTRGDILTAWHIVVKFPSVT